VRHKENVDTRSNTEVSEQRAQVARTSMLDPGGNVRPVFEIIAK
jgi:hypothetical protein